MASNDESRRASGGKVLLGVGVLCVGLIGGVVALSRNNHGSNQPRPRQTMVRWDYRYPTPQHNTLQGVWGYGRHVVTVGRSGAVVVSHDNGAHFRVRPIPTAEDLLSVWGDGNGNVIAVGMHGTIAKSDDWGDSWTSRPRVVGDVALTELWGDPRTSELFAVGREGAAFTSTDRGNTWRAIPTGSRSDLYAVWSNGSGQVVVGGRDGALLVSNDRGHSWVPRRSGTSHPLLSIYGDGHGLIVAAGWFGTVLESTDSGATFRLAPHTVDGDLTSVGSLGNGVIGAVGMRGTMIVRRPSGWSSVTTGAQENLFGMWSDGHNGVAIGTEGVIWRFRDQGTNWDLLTQKSKGAILSASGFGRARFVFGRGGLVLRSEDNGRTWDSSMEDSHVDILAGFAVSEREIFAANGANKILHSTDGGRTFTKTDPPAGVEGVSSVWASSPRDIYMAGSRGKLIHSSDGGATWRITPTQTDEDFFGMYGLNANEVFAVATRGVIIRSTDQGVSWQRMTNPSTRDLTAISGDRHGNMVAVGKEHEIVTSTNHGLNWRIAPVDASLITSFFGTCVAGDKAWYAAGLGATLLRSTDHGQTWRAESPFTSDDLNALWCDERDEPILGGYAGIVLTRAIVE